MLSEEHGWVVASPQCGADLSSDYLYRLRASAAAQVLMLRRGAGLGVAALEVRKASKSRRGGAREQRRRGLIPDSPLSLHIILLTYEQPEKTGYLISRASFLYLLEDKGRE